MVRKRLAELYGNRIMELTCVDDATDMEESVEMWIKKVIDVIQ
jgi:hypothetical protein